MDSKTNPKTTSSTLEILEAMRRNSEEKRRLRKALAKESLPSLPPSKQSKRPRTAQEIADYYDERRGWDKMARPRWPVGRSYPKNPRMPWNQKVPNAPDQEALKRKSLREALSTVALPIHARRFLVAYSYSDRTQEGVYVLGNITLEEVSEMVLEAGSLRHFQVQMLQQILGDFAPVGNVVLFCDDLSLVEHFNPARWEYYRANDWKEPTGDKLHFRVLYEQIDQLMEGRVVLVTFPEPNLPQVEKLTQRIKAMRKN